MHKTTSIAEAEKPQSQVHGWRNPSISCFVRAHSHALLGFHEFTI